MLSYYKKKIKIKGDNMMRYKKIVALGITIAVAGLSGCNQSTKLENMESISTNTEDKSEYFPEKFFASNTSGYYYWGYTDYMTFYDLNTKKSVLLCNKPDCKHVINNDNTIETDKDCNAYYSSVYQNEKVWTYGDCVFVLQKIDKKGLYLTQISSDSTMRKPVIRLSENTEAIVELIMNNGYAYYSIAANTTEGTAELYKVELKENAKPEKIDSIEGASPIITHLKAYDDNVYYVKFYSDEYNAQDPLSVEMNYQLYMYNEESDETKAVSDKNIDDYAVNVDDNELYYHECGGNVYKANLDDMTSECIYSDENLILSRIAYDGKYIYVDNFQDVILEVDDERKIYVIDNDGNIKKRVIADDDKRKATVEYGDDKYMFLISSKGYYMLDKGNIYSDEGDTCNEWMPIEVTGLTKKE